MCVRPVNGKRVMCPARFTFMYQSLASEWVSWIATSRRQFHLAVLFAGNFRRFATQLVRTETCLVARLAPVLTCAFGSLGARWISRYVLLLPRRVLQSVLGRSACVHCR